MLFELRPAWRLVGSIVLGGVTWGALYLVATKLQSSRIGNNITDYGSLPAYLIAKIFYPEGVHTGHGVSYFGYVLLGSGILFYTVVWFLILSWVNRRAHPLRRV